jgi:hypothetical protein
MSILVIKMQIKRAKAGVSITIPRSQADLLTFIFAVLFLIAYVAGRGVTDALADLKSKNFPVELCDTKAACKSVNLIKTIEVGVVYLQEQSDSVHFSKWADIFSISKRVDEGIRIPLACRWIPSICKTHQVQREDPQVNPRKKSGPS